MSILRSSDRCVARSFILKIITLEISAVFRQGRSEETHTDGPIAALRQISAMTVSKCPKLGIATFFVDCEVVDALDEGSRESSEPEADRRGECKKSRDSEVEWKCASCVHCFAGWRKLVSGSSVGHVSSSALVWELLGRDAPYKGR